MESPHLSDFGESRITKGAAMMQKRMSFSKRTLVRKIYNISCIKSLLRVKTLLYTCI